MPTVIQISYNDFNTYYFKKGSGFGECESESSEWVSVKSPLASSLKLIAELIESQTQFEVTPSIF